MTSQRKLTREEILALDFSQNILVEVYDTDRIEDEKTDLFDVDGEVRELTEYSLAIGAYGGVTLTSPCGVQIEFGWNANSAGTTYREAHTYNVEFADDLPDWIAPKGAVLVDEDGDEIDDEGTLRILKEVAEEIDWEQAVADELPEAETETLDTWFAATMAAICASVARWLPR
jgi:hypothetical protein